jgi:hypothetical protein
MPIPSCQRICAFHEKVALDLLARDGIGVIWKLHLDAANAYRGGFLNGAKILLATADAAERLIRHAAMSKVVGEGQIERH